LKLITLSRGETTSLSALPRELLQALEAGDRGPTEGDAALCVATSPAQDSATGRVKLHRGQRGASTVEAASDLGAMAQEVEEAKDVEKRDSGRIATLGEAAETLNEQGEQRRRGVAVGRQATQALHHPGPAPQPLEILPEGLVMTKDIEAVDPDQLRRLFFEEDEDPIGKELQGAAEARTGTAGRLGHAAELSVGAGVEGDDPVALSERPTPDHNRLSLL
jgi:hypothetical protein